MNKTVWIFQYPADVRKKGAQIASWYVGWYDLNGRRHSESCGPGSRGKNKAEKRQRRLQAELDLGVHQPPSKKTWHDFRKEYEAKILPNLTRESGDQIRAALNHFERLTRPGRVDQITTPTVDQFVMARRKERGKNPGSILSPATINKDLRHIKAALKVACDWEYLPKMPKIRMVREPEKLVRYVTPDDFAKIYREGCPLACLPDSPNLGYRPELWWKALLALAYMTGWRISELLALRWEDVDHCAGTIITRHGDNKGKRDERVPVHPVVVEHLQQIRSKGPLVFPWSHDERGLWKEFGRIQAAVGINLVCRENHEHTSACHVYGFHDLRRAFATVNAPRMKPEVLQKMMRHKSYKTTLGYINNAERIDEAVAELRVPDVLRPIDEANPTRSQAPAEDQRRDEHPSE